MDNGKLALPKKGDRTLGKLVAVNELHLMKVQSSFLGKAAATDLPSHVG
jgi:hypothetical protein